MTACDEEAFHYFLEIEQKRSQMSNRPFLLMLIDWNDAFIDNMRADKMLRRLTRSLRETDFVGWYREGRVIGAVLAQNADCMVEGAAEAVRVRVDRELQREIQRPSGSGFTIRMYQLSPQDNFWSR